MFFNWLGQQQGVHLVSTPVPDRTRRLTQQEAQPGHVVIINVSQHPEGLFIGVMTRSARYYGAHVGGYRLRVLLQQTAESANLHETWSCGK